MSDSTVIERPVTMGSAALRDRYASAYNNEPNYLQYRSFAEFLGLVGDSGSWAHAYINEAYLLNDEHDAYLEQAARKAHAEPDLFTDTHVVLNHYYRNDTWVGDRPFLDRLTEADHAGAVARTIYNEAVLANIEHNARQAAPTPVADITLSTYERDQEAALAQAEVLGATADQRRKLRGIVEAEHAARRRVAELETEVERLSQPLTADDRRVWPIFGEAAREANNQGYCSVYDQISAAVGIPRRDDLEEAGYLTKKRWDVSVNVEVSYTEYVTVTVEADTYDEAIREADRMSLTDIFQYMDSTGHYLERSDLDSHNAEEAEEVDD